MSDAEQTGRKPPRILAIEDEMLVAMLLEDMLGELGYETVGPLGRLAEAVEAAQREQIDAAILDVNLDGEPVYPVAQVLAERGVPIVFATGYGNRGLIGPWRDRPTLRKPYSIDELQAVLVQALGPAAAG